MKIATASSYLVSITYGYFRRRHYPGLDHLSGVGGVSGDPINTDDPRAIPAVHYH